MSLQAFRAFDFLTKAFVYSLPDDTDVADQSHVLTPYVVPTYVWTEDDGESTFGYVRAILYLLGCFKADFVFRSLAPVREALSPFPWRLHLRLQLKTRACLPEDSCS